MDTIIQKKLEEIKAEAARKGAKVKFEEHFIDDEHLDCFWYGGSIGSITLGSGWIILVEVNGEVRLHGQTENGEEIEYVNKANDGAWGKDVADYITGDAHLHSLQDSCLVEFGNNNWVEYNLITPDGDFVDMSEYADNVLDEDVLNEFLKCVQNAEQIVKSYEDGDDEES